MRPTRLTKFTAISAALGAALGAAVLFAPQHAKAADDEALDTKLLRGLLEGLGLKRDGSEGINYQERAPLVIPPGRDLPPPEKTDAALTNNPAWPKDPDVARRREEKRMEQNRNYGEEILRDEKVLSPSQMTPGRKPRAVAHQQQQVEPYHGEYGDRLAPGEQGVTRGLFSNIFGGGKDQQVRFTGEPTRNALTQPPPGYQTPSPDQPYGLGKGPPPKPTDYLTTHVEAEH